MAMLIPRQTGRRTVTEHKVYEARDSPIQGLPENQDTYVPRPDDGERGGACL